MGKANLAISAGSTVASTLKSIKTKKHPIFMDALFLGCGAKKVLHFLILPSLTSINTANEAQLITVGGMYLDVFYLYFLFFKYQNINTSVTSANMFQFNSSVAIANDFPIRSGKENIEIDVIAITTIVIATIGIRAY